MNISREDYLRVMYELHEENRSIRSVNIANELKVSKPSVSEMLKKLSKEKLIIAKPYSTIRLTRVGLKKAKRITHNHRMIELFLEQTLKYNSEKVHEEAHRLEHAFSDECIKKLRMFLNDSKKTLLKSKK